MRSAFVKMQCPIQYVYMRTEFFFHLCPTYGGRGYLEKQDFIIEKQKKTISVQREILTHLLLGTQFSVFIFTVKDMPFMDMRSAFVSFEKIEQLYYFEHYADHIQAQNERNEKTRHTERNSPLPP